MAATDRPVHLYRTQGLAAARQALADQYPDVLAQVIQLGQEAAPNLLAKAMVGAVCAGDQDNAVRFGQRLLPGVRGLKPLRLAPLATLAEYCGARGLRCDVVLPPEHIDLAATSVHTVLFAYDTEPAVFASVPRAQYIPGWDFLIGDDDTVLLDTGYIPLEKAAYAFMAFGVKSINSLVHHAPGEEIFVDEDVLFLSTPDASPGHWMIDFLPRLKGLNYVPGGKARVVVPANMPARYAEMLGALGISGGDVFACDEGKRYRFRTCHIYKPGRAEPPNPAHVRFVRDAFAGRGRLAPRPGKRVFMARSSVGTRLVANEGEFREFLVSENFVVADLADLSVDAQRNLLGDAEVILGAFGSNLLGLYFAPPGCAVIAMMNNLSYDMVVAPTAHILGMRHEYFICEDAPVSRRRRYKKDADIVVDCEALRRRLALISTRDAAF